MHPLDLSSNITSSGKPSLTSLSTPGNAHKLYSFKLYSSLSHFHCSLSWWSPRSHSGPVIYQDSQDSRKLLKAVLLVVTVYYSERIPVKISKEKRCIGRIQERPVISFQLSIFSGATNRTLNLPAMMCDNICEVLPPREANSCLNGHGV